MIESGQVAEIIVTLDGAQGRRGSGYRVGPTAVLTAAHVVDGAVSVKVRFDADLPGEWVTEVISCWTDPHSDLAVLTIAPRGGEAPVAPARFGRIGARAAVLAVRAVGFPRFKLKTDDGDGATYRDSHQADGSVAVLSNRREGTLEVTVPPPERDPDTPASPWEGMSGAAVWVGDRIVGVIAEHHRSDGLGRLAAARLDLALDGLDPGRKAELRALLTLPDVLPDVIPLSAGEWVATAYQAQVRDIAPERLLDREEELDELVKFCAGDQPYAWWQAGPWAGKSALMAWFVLHPPAGVDVVSFFITARLAGQSDSDACTDALIEQLAALIGESPAGLLTVGARRGTMLRLLRDVASRSREAGRRLLLVIDGLDEDSGATGPSIAALLPRRPPAEVRVLVASRPHPPIPDDVTGDHPLRMINPRQLAVSEHARDAEYRAKHELAQLLAGAPLQRDVLGLITAAGGGLTLSDLEELTEQPPYAIELLLGGVFGRSVETRTRTSGEQVYLFAHETLRLTAEQSFGKSLAPYRDRFHHWADTYRQRGWPPDTPQYLLRSYPRLLASTGDLARLVTCATDQARHERMRSLTGGDALAFTEISTAQQLLLAPPDPDLTSLALIAVQRDHLAERNAHIPTNLPAVWATLGQPTRAEALARSIPNPDRQASALGWVTEAVARSGDLDRAEALIPQITDLNQRARTLALLARAAGYRGDLDRAARLAAEIEALAGLFTDPFAKEGALLALAEATAAGGDLDRAQALIAQISLIDPDWALPALVEAAVAAGDLDRAEVLAGLVTNPYQRVRALAPLLILGGDRSELAARIAVEAEILAEQITDPYLRRHVLMALVDVAARAGHRDRVVRLATDVEALTEQIIDPCTRLRELVRAVAARGDHDRAAQLATEAYALTTQNTNFGERVRELTNLADAVADGGDRSHAARLATEVETLMSAQNLCPDALDRAVAQLAEAPATSGDLDRAEALVGRLTRPIKQTALLALLEATAAGGDLDRAQALIAQHSLNPDFVSPALVEAAMTAGDLDRAEALAGLATDPYWRVRALRPLLMLTGDHSERAARLTTEAEILTEQISDSFFGPFTQASALIWLAEAAVRAGDVDRAARLAIDVEALVGQTTESPLLVPTLAALVWVVAAGGDHDRATQLAAEVETLTGQITDPYGRGQALTDLAKAVAAGGDHCWATRLAGEAEAITSQINDPDQRGQALTDLAKAVAAWGDHDRTSRLAGEAETLAGQIRNPDRRAAALARIAMTLLETSGEASPPRERARNGSPVLVRVRRLLAEAFVTGSWTEVVSSLARVDPLAVGALSDELRARWGFDAPGGTRGGSAGEG